MKISQNSEIFSREGVARAIGILISDFIYYTYDLTCKMSYKGTHCTIEILRAVQGLKYQSPGCSIRDNVIEVNDRITLEELSDVLDYLRKTLVEGSKYRKPEYPIL